MLLVVELLLRPMNTIADRILYEDNHLIVVNKLPSEIVQGDKTGDKCLLDDVKEYIKEKYDKPGNVFAGLVHRIDRPVSGAVVFAKTSKALSRMTVKVKDRDFRKTYLALVKNHPPKQADVLEDFIVKNEKMNKIRCQLAHIGCPIRGDLKYGYPRSNPDASISLHAWRIAFEHPVLKTQIEVTAPLPDVSPWTAFNSSIQP